MTKKASWFASMLLFALTASISVAVAQAQEAASKDAAGFIGKLGELRVWDREPKVKMK